MVILLEALLPLFKIFRSPLSEFQNSLQDWTRVTLNILDGGTTLLAEG